MLKRLLTTAVCMSMLWLQPQLVQGAETPAAKPSLGLGGGGLEYPSLARVVLGFVFTVALGVGAVVLLRKVMPGFNRRPLPAGDLQVVSRANVSNSLRVHVVQVGSSRIVIAEGRNAIGMLTLPEETKTQMQSQAQDASRS